MLSLALSLALAFASSPPTNPSIRAVFVAQATSQLPVGIALGIIHPKAPHQTFLLGFEDRERAIPLSNHTMFRWASISKPLTAVVAARLALEGKLDLDKDIRSYVPEFPIKDPNHPITTRQLLGHLAGIVHYTNGPVIPTVRRYDRDHPYQDVVLALDTFNNSPLISIPGADFNYSTRGFMLASAVIERAGGAPFHELVNTYIAQPLGLTTLQPDYQWVDIPHRTVGYRKRGEVIMPSTNSDVSWKLGGGGFISSIGDLTRFAQGLLDPAFITPPMRALLWTPQTTTSGNATGYGLGFGIKTVENDRLLVQHSGAQEKTRTLLLLFPDDGVAVTLMTNSEYVTLRPIANTIKNKLFHEEPAVPAPKIDLHHSGASL